MRRGIAIAAALLGAAATSGCAIPGLTRRPVATAPTPAPAVAPAPAPAEPPKVMRVFVPKPIKCVPEDLGPPPAYPDSDSALREAGGAADRYQLLAAGRLLRDKRLQKLEDVIKHCRNAAR